MLNFVSDSRMNHLHGRYHEHLFFFSYETENNNGIDCESIWRKNFRNHVL